MGKGLDTLTGKPVVSGFDRGCDERTVISMDARAIKMAIAHYLSRQGSAEFDAGDVALMFNNNTGEVVADAQSRRVYNKEGEG